MWIKGRQNSGYSKLKLLESKLLKFDIYLLKYPKGSYIDVHIDPSPEGYEHHRLNLILKKAEKGGTFVLDNVDQIGRIHKFRPDIQEHSLHKIESGTRWVLSFGWLKKEESWR